jgi:CheY-like chemotaxis protein
VLINLVNNAVKFTEQGSVSVRVSLQQKSDEQAMLRFAVRDTGIGLSEPQRQGLFQSFQQADSSITRKFGGTGLGLAISKRLVELMGGAIEVESAPGQGSTFSFTALLGLGAGQPAGSGERSELLPLSSGARQPALSAKDELRGARVLLVEDNELNQEVATEFLQALGLQVDLAENGQLALDKLQGQPYDVVLMDMQMPVMDGLTATRQIRQRPGLQQLPILAMTANAMAADRQRCLDAGMNDHIAKPIDLQDLTDKLLRWVNPVRAADPVAPRVAAAQQPQARVQAGDEECWVALGQIAGLDSRLGLGQAAGRKPLYLGLLAKFVADQAEAPDRLAQAIAVADWDAAERLAHTLKGVSAQIGALPLRDCAAGLEQAIRQKQPAPELEALQLKVRQLLQPLLQQITAALPRGDAGTPAPSLDLLQWQDLRARLARLLRESDTEAVALFEANKTLARQALGSRFDPMEQALGQFDFAMALELIDQA